MKLQLDGKIWKDIPGFPDYQLSSDGEVRGINGKILAYDIAAKKYFGIFAKENFQDA